MNTETETTKIVLQVMRDIFARTQEQIADDYKPKEVIKIIEREIDEVLSRTNSRIQE